MAAIQLRDRTLTSHAGETVLDCLERHGIEISASCRSGVCQSCMMKVRAGALPKAAQEGLKDSWKALGQFLPCVCVPIEDLVIDVCDAAATHSGRVARVEPLRSDVLRIALELGSEFHFQAGQFLSLVRPEDGLTRPYSIASLPGSGSVELHVAVLPGGRMSGWLKGAVGQEVLVRGPSGECFYQPGAPAQPLLLAGTGTGLAPLLGVVRAALQAGHHGPVHLYHGSRRASGLYLFESLLALAERHPNLQVVGSALDNDLGHPAVREQPIDQVIFGDLPKLDGFRVYLCGNPDRVGRLKKRAFLAGADLSRIHSDPFVRSPSAATPVNAESRDATHKRPHPGVPNPAR